MKTSGLRWEKLTLELRNPFRLSYGVSDTRETYWLRLADDSGWGEATLPPYYGVDLTQMGVIGSRCDWP
jgi:L-alanine-DL-glutamate epimerase-like enolase superfamily enzyme